MQYIQNTGDLNTVPQGQPPAQVKTEDTLQDLIDILQQNYVSDCPHCAGTGMNLRYRACKPCSGKGKLQKD